MSVISLEVILTGRVLRMLGVQMCVLAPHSNVSVNEGPHIRLRSNNIIIMKVEVIPLQARCGPEGG